MQKKTKLNKSIDFQSCAKYKEPRIYQGNIIEIQTVEAAFHFP